MKSTGPGRLPSVLRSERHELRPSCGGYRKAAVLPDHVSNGVVRSRFLLHALHASIAHKFLPLRLRVIGHIPSARDYLTCGLDALKVSLVVCTLATVRQMPCTFHVMTTSNHDTEEIEFQSFEPRRRE